MPLRDWRLCVEDILDGIARIERYVDGLSSEQFRADQKTVDAVVRNLEIIGEAVRHLASEEQNPAGGDTVDRHCRHAKHPDSRILRRRPQHHLAYRYDRFAAAAFQT